MQITDEWLASISDDHGLTPGQSQLLAIWKARQAFAGYGYLPDQVAVFLAGCKGYRGMPESLRQLIAPKT
jgi:hypothetical protein